MLDLSPVGYCFHMNVLKGWDTKEDWGPQEFFGGESIDYCAAK